LNVSGSMNFTPFTNWSRHRLGQPERDEQADWAEEIQGAGA